MDKNPPPKKLYYSRLSKQYPLHTLAVVCPPMCSTWVWVWHPPAPREGQILLPLPTVDSKLNYYPLQSNTCPQPVECRPIQSSCTITPIGSTYITDYFTSPFPPLPLPYHPISHGTAQEQDAEKSGHHPFWRWTIFLHSRLGLTEHHLPYTWHFKYSYWSQINRGIFLTYRI